MAPTAYIVHQIHGRVRFRIKEKRQDTEYFELLRERLESIPDIVDVRINEARGSVLLLHPDISFSDLATELGKLDVFEIAEGHEPETPALAPLLAGIKKLDQAISSGTSGGVDLRTLLFVGALIIAIRQMRRGELFSPALPLLWSAMDMVSRLGKTNSPDDLESVD